MRENVLLVRPLINVALYYWTKRFDESHMLDFPSTTLSTKTAFKAPRRLRPLKTLPSHLTFKIFSKFDVGGAQGPFLIVLRNSNP